MSHSQKIFLPSPLHLLFSVFQLYERGKGAGNRKLDLFPSLSPKCRAAVQPCKSHQLLRKAATGLSGRPMMHLQYLHGPAILQSCITHQDVVGKFLDFTSLKVLRETAQTLHQPHLQCVPTNPTQGSKHPQCLLLGPGICGRVTKRNHPFTARSVCFVSKIATLRGSTHSVTEPCPGGNPPPVILLLCLSAF